MFQIVFELQAGYDEGAMVGLDPVLKTDQICDELHALFAKQKAIELTPSGQERFWWCAGNSRSETYLGKRIDLVVGAASAAKRAITALRSNTLRAQFLTAIGGTTTCMSRVTLIDGREQEGVNYAVNSPPAWFTFTCSPQTPLLCCTAATKAGHRLA